MKRFFTPWITLFILLLSFLSATAQRRVEVPGQILEPGNAVLDPNGDGYVSEFSTGFADTFDVDEFEIPMFGIPIFGEGEAAGDLSAGQDCGVVDLALDSAGFAVYATLDDDDNLIFRFRLAGLQASVKSYSIFLDADNAVGSADSNSTSNNPGFEYALTVIKGRGSYFSIIDGLSSCPTAILEYDETFQQVSVAGSENCGDTDYFIDVYVPFGDIESVSDLTTSSKLRFSGVTHVSATCPLGGKLSDIGGVDDADYNGCFECAVLDLTDNQCSVSLDELCADCGGFPTGPAAPPVIDKPVQEGFTTISGTAEPFADVFITIFDVNEIAYVEDTVQASADSVWASGVFSPPLSLGDSIVVFAASQGKCNSGLSIIGTNYALVAENNAPIIGGNGDTYEFFENRSPLKVDSTILLVDDAATLQSAVVDLTNGYQQNEDTLFFDGVTTLSVSWDDVNGRLMIQGEATIEVYRDLLRNVEYWNNSEDPSEALREITYYVNDGANQSNFYKKNIILRRINDAPYYYETSIDNKLDTVRFTINEDDTLDFCLNVYDIEGDPYSVVVQADEDPISSLITNGSENCYRFIPGKDLFGVDHISLNICDQAVDTICTVTVVEVTINPVNDPPWVTQFGNATDTLRFSTSTDLALEVCVEASDVEGDNFTITEINNPSLHSSIAVSSDLCFDFTPNSGVGDVTEYVEVIVCDDAVDQKCDTVIASVRIESTNEPPIIDIGGDITIDTLYFTIQADSLFSYCLEASDPNDNDNVSVDTVIVDKSEDLYKDLSILNQLCIEFTPEPDTRDTVTLKTLVCDNGIPQKCDSIYLIIDIINGPPEVNDDRVVNDTIRHAITSDSTLNYCLKLVDSTANAVTTETILTTVPNGNFTTEINADQELCYQYVPVETTEEEFLAWIKFCDNDADNPLCDSVAVFIGVNYAPELPSPQFPDNVDSIAFEIYSSQTLSECINLQDVNGNDLNVVSTVLKQGAGRITSRVNDDTNQLCIDYTPGITEGVTWYEITICDDGEPQTCTVFNLSINVLPTNIAPKILYESTDVDTVQFFITEDSIVNKSLSVNDPDNNNVSYESFEYKTGSSGFSITDAVEYDFSYDASQETANRSAVLLKVIDDGEPDPLRDSVLLEFFINRSPIVQKDGMDIDTIRINLVETDVINDCLSISDPNGDALDATVSAIDGDGDFTITNDCYEFDPSTGTAAFSRFKVSFCDGNGLCEDVVFEFTTNRIPVVDDPEVVRDTISYTITDGETINKCITINDPNSDNLTTTYSLIEGTDDGFTITDAANACFSYDDSQGTGTFNRFKVTVCDDGTPSSLCREIVINISINEPPVIEQSNAPVDTIRKSMLETEVINECLDVTDANGDQIEVSITTIEGDGDFTITNDCYEFDPSTGTAAFSRFKASFCDGNGLCEDVVFEFTVNRSPIVNETSLVNDTIKYRVSDGEILSRCISVEDPNNDQLTSSFIYIDGETGIEITDPAKACFTFDESATTELFTRAKLTICDDGAPESLCEVIILEFTVNEPPVVKINNAAVDTIAVNVDEGNTIRECLNVEDPNNDNVTITTENISGNSQFTLTDEENFCYEITPGSGEEVENFIKVTLCDDGDPTQQCNEVIFEISINRPPKVIFEEQEVDTVNFYLSEGDSKTECLQLQDLNQDDLTVDYEVAVGGNGFSQGLQNSGCFSFNATATSDTLTVIKTTVCDNGTPNNLCKEVVLRFFVNLAPVLVEEDPDNGTMTVIDTVSFSITEDETVEDCFNIDDANQDNVDLSFEVLQGAGNFEFTDLDSFCYKYVPDAEIDTLAIVKVTICDDGTPSELCNEIIIEINVNQKPEVVINGVRKDTINFNLLKNEALDSCLSIIDPNGDQLDISGISQPDNGILKADLSSDDRLCLNFTTEEDFVGELAGKVLVCDDGIPEACREITILVSIFDENDDPEFVRDGVRVDTLTYSIAFDQPLEECVQVRDKQEDKLEVSTAVFEAGAGDFTANVSDQLCFSYSTNEKTNSQNYITVEVCDDAKPNKGCNTIVLEINVNFPPQILTAEGDVDTVYYEADENFELSECLNLVDKNMDQLSVNSAKVAGGGSLAASIKAQQLCFDFSADEQALERNIFELSVCDDREPQLCDKVFIVIDKPEVNTPPGLIIDGVRSDTLSVELIEGESFSDCFEIIDFESNQVQIVEQVLVSGENFFNAGVNESSLCIEFVPEELYYGESVYQLILEDNGEPVASSTFTVIINTVPVNNMPVAQNDTIVISTTENYSLNVLLNDSDPENEGISVSQVFTAPEGMNVSIASDSVLNISVESERELPESFTYEICDAGIPTTCVTADVIVLYEFESILPLRAFEAFSPNGDGVNDQWIIEGIEAFPGNTVVIFDQWNNVIFKVKGYNNTEVVWKGEKNGTLMSGDAEDGVYYYLIRTSDENKAMSGFVVLKR